MTRPAPSLRLRLLGWLLTVSILSLLISPLAAYLIVRNVTAESLDQGLADAAALYAEHAREHRQVVPTDLPGRVQRVLLATPDDRVLFSLQDAEGRLLSGEAWLATERPWGTLQAPEFFDLQHGGFWLRGITVVFDAGNGQAWHLTMATTALKREKLMGEVILGMALPQTLLLLATITLVWFGIREGLAPLTALRSQIARRSHRDMRALDAASTPLEVRPMVDELNALFVRLEQALEAQRQFVADAAHQLRTPVAGLLAQVEAGDGGHDNPVLIATARRMSHLVRQLLALSRAEPGIEAAHDTFDLAELVRTFAGEWLPHLFRHDMEIEFDLAATRLTASPHACRELLANLLDNALRHGHPHGRIVVRCHPDNNEAVVQVDDDGPGIAPDQRERAFERFYRLPGTLPEGCGLGLAIVRGLVQQHHGSVCLTEAPALGGLRVEVRLPLFATADPAPTLRV